MRKANKRWKLTVIANKACEFDFSGNLDGEHRYSLNKKGPTNASKAATFDDTPVKILRRIP